MHCVRKKITRVSNSNENYRRYNVQPFANISGNFRKISEILNFREIRNQTVHLYHIVVLCLRWRRIYTALLPTSKFALESSFLKQARSN